MNTTLKLDPNKLLIFHELIKRKIYVGELIYDEEKDVYLLSYDEHYAKSKQAIPLAHNLDLFTKVHVSKKGKLFPALLDRIPVRENPAYEDYCLSQNITVDEKNPIILLGTIGRRGPSSFVFERIYKTNFSMDKITQFRKKLNISQHDFAEAFGISKVTLQKMESGQSHDARTLKLLQIYFTFPEVAIWQLQQTGAKVHSTVLARLFTYFHERILKTNKT